MATLGNLVQSLPREIFDDIYDLTFTASPDNHIINEAYEPPNCLQVSQDTREAFAKSYYEEGSTFLVKSHKWARSLEKRHAKMLTSIYITDKTIIIPVGVPRLGANKPASWLRSVFHDGLRELRTVLQTTQVRTKSIKFRVNFLESLVGKWICRAEVDELVHQFHLETTTSDCDPAGGGVV